MNVSVFVPPGSFYPSIFREGVPDLRSLVQAHVTPDSSIHDVAEKLASEILANFPAATQTDIMFTPDIRISFPIDKLQSITCVFFLRPSTCIKHPITEPQSIYECKTEWAWPISPGSRTNVLLSLISEEHSASPVHNQMPRSDTSRFRSTLSHVHPTFDLHEKVAKFAVQQQRDTFASTAPLLAQSFFHLADIQSPCKRIRRVRVRLRGTISQMDPSRTKLERLADIRSTKYNNHHNPFCLIKLERHQYEQSKLSLVRGDVQSKRHRAFVALGSNIGNRIKMIEWAVREMNEQGLTVLRTSALYETKPMYLEEQEAFINGACEVCSTDVSIC